MIISIGEVTVSNVWKETFTGRDGDEVEFFRALVNVPGEPPLQLGVTKDDFPELSAMIGRTGEGVIDLDARPGNRVRVHLKEVLA